MNKEKLPEPPWMPLHVHDYLKDTTRLSTEMHGAYLLLILDYWQSGPLPDDNAKLARITRLSPREWMVIRASIECFFRVHGGKWTHKRIEAEYSDAVSRMLTSRENGKRGGRPPKNPPVNQQVNPQITHRLGSGHPESKHTNTNTKSKSPNHEEVSRGGAT